MFFSFLRCSSRGNGRRQRDISPSDVVSRGSRFRNSRGRSSLTCGTVQSFPVPSSRRSKPHHDLILLTYVIHPLWTKNLVWLTKARIIRDRSPYSRSE